MSVYNLWDKDMKESKLKTNPSSEWNFNSTLVTPRSRSPPTCGVGEAIFNNYLELIHSKSNISTNAKQTEQLERPFDYFDEEFAFGINLLNKNVACVGDNITKLIQLAQEPWPDNVKLFQPYEVEQILLPDNASCLAVQAFLKMCNLPFEVEMRWNAEWMSPSGRVPFIKCGAFVVSELEPIVQFAANKGVSLCSQLATEEKAEMRAYMSLITNVLVNAELYVSWIDNDTFNTVTKVRNSSVYPWPLGWIQTRAKRNMVAKRLKALNWYDKTLDQVLADVEQCCNSLSQRLGEKDYFFGTPTPLDALVYGHLRSLLAATGPKAALMIKPITSALLRLVLRMANLTAMKLTNGNTLGFDKVTELFHLMVDVRQPQEDYLVAQAFQVSRRRKMSPDRESRNSRTRRSRMSMRNPSRDSLGYSRDMFGFKPFACKHIIIMTSKEGHITCELDGRRHDKVKALNEEQNNFIVEIIEDILDKVEEFAFTEKIYFETEKNDFEVIAFANNYVDSKYGSLDMKFDELRESNETLNDDDDISLVDDDNLTLQGDTNTPVDVENDDIDVMPFESGLADVLEIINDEDEMLDLFDGLGNDEDHELRDEDNVELNDAMIESVLETSTEIDSSNNNEMLESCLCISSGDQSSPRLVNSSGDRGSISNLSPDLKSPKSASSTKSSRFSSESKSTLKIPSNEEISVESLLRCLRKRNAAYNSYPDIADID